MKPFLTFFAVFTSFICLVAIIWGLGSALKHNGIRSRVLIRSLYISFVAGSVTIFISLWVLIG